MKFTFLLALVILHPVAVLANIPDAITCTSKAKMPELKKFHLSDINTDSPSMNMYDVPFNENYSDEKIFSLYFSNECENSYVLTIPMDQMKRLQAGKLKKVTGELEYSQYVGSDDVEFYDETVQITCTK